MKQLFTLGFIVSVVLLSCENDSINNVEEIDNEYSKINEISIPTDSPWGLAFDGKYLWYSDDADRNLYKLSGDGSILATIELNNCKITGFDFYDNYILCINDTTVLNDESVSHYPYSCLYKYTITGERIDSILIQASVNPQRPEFIGITVNNSTIIGSSDQGWSSCLYSLDAQSEEVSFLQYYYLTGLTCQNDTIFAVDRSNISKNQIVCFDSQYRKIEDKSFVIDYIASDLAFANNDLWICDRENKMLRKIK